MASEISYNRIHEAVELICSGLFLPLVHDEGLEDALTEQDAAFACLVDEETTDTLASIGSPTENWYREAGQLDLNLYAPAKDGFGPVRQYGAVFANSLRHKVLPDRVKLEAIQPPAPGTISNGQWSHMVITIPFTRQRAAATA